MRRLAVLALLLPALALAGMPERARKYQRPLTANARAVWGLSAPIATLAGQVQQESGWREDAHSAYADGLAQFTPTTAEWISGAYRGQLGTAAPFNPAWALRALVLYDKQLAAGVTAADDCERMAMALSAYNGGLGNLKKDQALCQAAGCDPQRWWDNVEHLSRRASWAFQENRGYPRAIIRHHQQMYASWGPGVCA